MSAFYTSLLLAVGLFTLQSCTSPAKLLENGQCQQALQFLLKKTEHPNGYVKWKPLLRQAYDCIQEEDLTQIAIIQQQDDPAYLARLVALYDALKRRQDEVLPYLPNVPLVDYHQRWLDASKRAAIYYFAQAKEHFTAARQGDKNAARRAYKILNNALYFDHQNWTPTASARSEMFDLGTLRIQMDLSSRADDYEVYPGLAKAVQQVPEAPTRKDWVEIHWIASRERIDYYAVPDIMDLQVSACEELTNCTEYEEEVKVGEEQVKQTVTEGDSSWTVVVVEEIFETVYATVCEITQSRSARLAGHLLLYNAQNEVAQELPLTVRAGWSNKYDEGSGDARALPACFGMRWSFPSVYDMESMLGKRLIRVAENDLIKNFGSE